MVTFAEATAGDGQTILDIYGETIQHRPCGILSDEEDITAFVDKDALAGSGPGAAESIEDERGTRFDVFITIEVLPTVGMAEKDTVVIGGKVYEVVRSPESDNELEAWVCRRTKKISTRARGAMS